MYDLCKNGQQERILQAMKTRYQAMQGHRTTVTTMEISNEVTEEEALSSEGNTIGGSTLTPSIATTVPPLSGDHDVEMQIEDSVMVSNEDGMKADQPQEEEEEEEGWTRVTASSRRRRKQ